MDDLSMRNSEVDKQRRAPLGLIVAGTLFGMAHAVVKRPLFGDLTDIGFARNQLVWAIIGCAGGCCLCLRLGRGRFAIRHIFELTLAMAIVAMLLRKYEQQKQFADLDQVRMPQSHLYFELYVPTTARPQPDTPHDQSKSMIELGIMK